MLNASRPRISTHRACVRTSRSPRAACSARSVSPSLSTTRRRFTSSAATRAGRRSSLHAHKATVSLCRSSPTIIQRTCGAREDNRAAMRGSCSRNGWSLVTVRSSARSAPGPAAIRASVTWLSMPRAWRAAVSRGAGAPAQPSAEAIAESASMESAAERSSAAARRVRTRRGYARGSQHLRPVGCDYTHFVRMRVCGCPVARSQYFQFMRAIGAVMTAVLLASATRAAAQSPTGATITGIVLDVSGRPVVDADVFALPEKAKARTDSAGRFTITKLDAGFYHVRVRRLGFTPTEITTDLEKNGHVELKFELTPRPVILD